VIRNSIGFQRQLNAVPESSTQYSGGPLNLNIATGSLGSSSASSVTDSPSPSPTGGLLLPAVEDTVTPTAPVRQLPAVSGDDDRAKAALLAELVARLGPQDVAALIRALQVPGTTSSSTAGLLPRGMDGGDADGSAQPWQSDTWPQYHQFQHLYEQQQQQNGHTTSNICSW